MSPHSLSFTHRLVTKLWKSWALSFGAIALIMFVPVFLPKVWLPALTTVLAFAMLAYLRSEQRSVGAKCLSMVKVGTYTLFWSAFIMLLIVIGRRYVSLDMFFPWAPSNSAIPFVVCLIVFPVAAVICLWVMAHGYGQPYSARYRARTQIMTGNGVVASLLARESRYQVRLMFAISVAMTVIDWWYFFVYYYNVNMNTPDRFFFNYMPGVIYLASLYFVWNRNTTIALMIGPVAIGAREKGTMVRYLIMAGDRMLLTQNQNGRWDTPAITYIPGFTTGDDKTATDTFARISGIDDATIRFLYQSPGADLVSDVEHYAAVLPTEEIPESWLGAEWCTLDVVDRYMRSGQLSPELADEIYRIVTVTLAWKTYDRDGRRLYPIKNYRPTFRLRDFGKWTVDYSDITWLGVASNNQDRTLYRLRRFWRKLTSLKFVI